MPDVTPAGPVAVAVDALRTLIANITWFQTWTASANAAAALLRIFVGEVGFPIATVAIAGGVMTVTTREPHTIQVGDVVTIEGASTGEQGLDIDGGHIVATVTSTTFTVVTIFDDLAAVHPDQAFVVPCPRPLAVIGDMDNSVSSQSVGTGGASICSGALEILLEADVSTAYHNDHRNALYEARNAYGNLVQGLMETQGTGDFMFLNSVEPVSGPEFTSRSEQDDNTIRFERWRALIRVTWGLEG